MRQIIRLRSRFMEPDKVYEVDRPEYYHGWPVYSQAFVCPQCTWCWATVGVPPFQVMAVPCAWHPEACHPILRPVAGSLLDNSTFTIGPDLDLLAALPLELKQREFDLHVKAAERKEDSWEDQRIQEKMYGPTYNEEGQTNAGSGEASSTAGATAPFLVEAET